jgi:hypothetical protein
MLGFIFLVAEETDFAPNATTRQRFTFHQKRTIFKSVCHLPKIRLIPKAIDALPRLEDNGNSSWRCAVSRKLLLLRKKRMRRLFQAAGWIGENLEVGYRDFAAGGHRHDTAACRAAG